jgi:hypothetical protein
VIPSDVTDLLFLGYPVQRGFRQFLDYLNYWFKLKQSDGFGPATYSTWIAAEPPNGTGRRWNLLHDVLHW